MKKLILVIVAILACMAFLSACSGGGDSTNTADIGAKEWLTALAAGDSAKITDRLCSDKATLKPADMWKEAFSGTGLSDPKTGKVDVSGLKLAVKTVLRDSGYVTVTGSASLDGKAIDVNQVWLMAQESGKWKWCGQ